MQQMNGTHEGTKSAEFTIGASKQRNNEGRNTSALESEATNERKRTLDTTMPGPKPVVFTYRCTEYTSRATIGARRSSGSRGEPTRGTVHTHRRVGIRCITARQARQTAGPASDRAVPTSGTHSLQTSAAGIPRETEVFSRSGLAIWCSTDRTVAFRGGDLRRGTLHNHRHINTHAQSVGEKEHKKTLQTLAQRGADSLRGVTEQA